MKILTLILLMLMAPFVLADEVKIELNPAKPVVGEMFQAIFRIFTNDDVEPVINFSPFKVEVVGKNNYGIKTSTVFMNGKFSTSREMTIIYDLAAGQAGIAGLRDINVQLGSKTLRHPSLTFNVLKEPEVAADVFVMAEVPKKQIFLGEGIVVRYYLYGKVQVTNLDIKKYPKLNNFLKRFLQEPDRSERVTVDGQMYVRTQIYGAKLFPEKTGELKIDPLHVSATVSTSRGGDPFGTFGMGREARVKSVSSETVKVEVRPLPEEGKDANFTGLVGKHDFDLHINSTRLIVNEPLEVKLTVSGGGALENMEAPSIFKHDNLEEFESNGDLKIMDADQATKVFDYTFLPKADLTIPASTLTLTYFDPDSMRYVPIQLPVSELVVAGGTMQKKKDEKPVTPETEEKSIEMPKIPTSLAGPILEGARSWKSYLNLLNFGLSAVALLIALGIIIKKEKLPGFSSHSIPGSFKKGQFHLSEFTRWMTPLISKTGKSPLTVIKESELTPETKSYFIDLLNSNDYKDYSHAKGQLKFVYRSNSFKELDKYIQSVKNEDTTQSA
ncbi:MAG: BatD family protein [Bdellovibrionales bacterium]|nr:BatD family protein [Bdellovibrionales bacterium]